MVKNRANKRAGGKGEFASLFHIVRSWPALPQHERSATAQFMRAPRLGVALAFAFALAGCGDRPAPPEPQSLTTTNAEQEKFWRLVAEARQMETDADVVLTTEGARGTNSALVLRPAMPSLTNELSTTADFNSLATSLQRHDSAVIVMAAEGWDTNQLAAIAGHLHGAGFHSVRAIALRWGKSFPGPAL